MTQGWQYPGKAVFFSQCIMDLENGSMKHFIFLSFCSAGGQISTFMWQTQPVKWSQR